MKFAYLAFLLFSITSMVFVDKKFSLAFFYNVKRTAITLLTGIIVFIIWDIFGISLDIFIAGTSKYMTGILLAPNFPLEELFFLTFLCYFTLIVYLGAGKLWQRT